MRLTVALLLAVFVPACVCAQTTQNSQSEKSAAQKVENRSPARTAVGSATSITLSPIEVLSDTQGVDFAPYLTKVLKSVRQHWYELIPEEARSPELKQGKVSIEFVILRDGKVAGMTLVGPSTDVAMDRAAWGGIEASAPFAPLPDEFHGRYVGVRFHFYYNPEKATNSGQK